MSPLGQRNYIILFGFLGLICLTGLWTPLMDNDAAHHANIALHMYLNGDYVNLIDNGGDYLDKPHLHFWLAALSFKFFGANEVAYKLPSFLLSIGGLFSMYKLGSLLYNREVGRLSALILATAFAFFVSLNDVRMDAILVAAICFSCWQIISSIEQKNPFYLFGAALGLAVGFSVKGAVGVIIPILFMVWYLIENHKWNYVRSFRPWVIMLLMSILIMPVLYCYYIQFDLHPEKVIRGKDHISGIKFSLFGGSTERFTGGMSSDGKKDWFFFFYTFLWAFAPCSIIAYIAVFKAIRAKKQWFLSATLLTIAILIGAAGSKLPHYLNISFPFAALLTAHYLNKNPLSKPIKVILYSMTGIMLVSNLLVNGWLFPEDLYRLAAFVGIFLLTDIISSKTAKDVLPFTYVLRVTLLLYLILNLNFYPQLLAYQGGQELANKIKGKVDPETIYFWKNNYSSSFCFAIKTLRKEWNDSLVLKQQKQLHLVYDINYEKEVLAAGLILGERVWVKDFEVTKLDKEFVVPKTRESHCSKLVIAKLIGVRKQ